MLKENAEDRQRVLTEARSWLKTPYLTNSLIKGPRGGVDCAMLLVGVYRELGMIDPTFDPRPYPPEWHLHKSEEKYMNFVGQFGKEIFTDPKPGDIVLFKVARLYAHGGIVANWPNVIHARSPFPVIEENISRDVIGKHALFRLDRRFFSLFEE